ncbi:unnamed protein product [Urochloa humidicola]
MGGDQVNAPPAVGGEQRHPEPVLPDAAEGSSPTEAACPYVDMLRYYRARRQFRFGRFLAPMRFPDDDDAWMRFTDDESAADDVYRNGRFGALEEATVGDDETSMDGDDDDLEEPPVVEFDDLLRMRQALLHRFSAPTRSPPEHGAAHTTLAIIHETMMEIIFGLLDNVPDGGGAAAYRNGGFGAVPAAEEAISALPETTVGEGEARGKECAVCLEGYESGDTVRTMPCSHGFHERCILHWLRVSRLCPICRFAMPAAAGEETESFTDEQDDDILESIQFMFV